MTAKITNIIQYRGTKVLPTLSDKVIKTRIAMLRNVENGELPYEAMPGFLQNSLFPLGYNPVFHPEDNLEALTAEAKRRGVYED